MKLTLRRTTFTPHSTIGELSVDGVPECYTLEDAVREDGIKIFGETAIPAGKYRVELTKSPRFHRVLPLLVDVKNFIGIRIHPGNSPKDTDGCILVGRTKAVDWVGQSGLAFDRLFDKMNAAHLRGETLTMEIT